MSLVQQARGMVDQALPISSSPRPIQFWLAWLVVACILPAGFLAGFLIMHAYERERAGLEANTIATARALTQAVDWELTGAQSTLQALATSPSLASGDLARFYDQATTLLRSQTFNNIVLSDGTGQQRLNTLRPFGAPLPLHGNLDQLRRVLANGKPVISDLYIGAVTRKPLIGVEVPVVVKGRATYGLAAGIFPERLGEILKQQQIPPNWVVAIVDRSGTLVQRTLDPDKFIGMQASPDLLRALGSNAEGIVEGPTLEGIQTLAGFSRSPVTGWTVAIGVPTAAVTADLHQALWLNAAAALFLLVLGVILARLISRRIGRSIGALAKPALAFGSRGKLDIPATEISEVDALGRALVKAARLIEQRAEERDAAAYREREMLVAKQAAEQASAAKSNFLAIMSHELRTPLNGILGFAQLLNEKFFGDLTAKQREFVDHILTSGNHLLELINDVLELSKIEAGRLTVSIERVDLVPLMKSVLATLEAPASQAKVRLNAPSLGGALPAVKADRVRLAQALLNLGSNAIKYNRADGAATFTIERLANGFVRLAVSDTGIGILEERQAELFQPFNRLGAERRAIEGTGVGLALTRRLVEAMGGKIGFTSKPDAGSRFWVDIPEYVGASEAPHLVAPVARSPQRRRAEFTVLSIDDNPSNRLLLRNVLATCAGAHLLEAADGASGLSIAQELRPDLIILDINLPDRSGFTVLQEVQRNPALAHIPVLGISAAAMAQDIKRSLDAGFFRYLTKPIDVNKLFEAIDDALDLGETIPPEPSRAEPLEQESEKRRQETP